MDVQEMLGGWVLSAYEIPLVKSKKLEGYIQIHGCNPPFVALTECFTCLFLVANTLMLYKTTLTPDNAQNIILPTIKS